MIDENIAAGKLFLNIMKAIIIKKTSKPNKGFPKVKL
jgi:hypothetical protein